MIGIINIAKIKISTLRNLFVDKLIMHCGLIGTYQRALVVIKNMN